MRIYIKNKNRNSVLICILVLIISCCSVIFVNASAYDGFINDARWKNGTTWNSSQRPKLANFSSYACCAYCADFVKYNFGKDNPRAGTIYYNAAETRAGDIVTVGNQSDGTGHWYAVLDRNGNNLYVAEGNVNGKVRVGWNYTVSGSLINGRSIVAYHFASDTPPAPVRPKTSGASKVNIPSGIYTIHSAWDYNQVLDIGGDSKDNRANIQLYQQTYNDVQKFRIIKMDGYYVVKSIYSGKWLDARLPIGDWSNVQLWESNTSEEEKWILEDAGNGYVYFRNMTDYYMDVQGDVAKNNQNIQLYHFVGNNSQKWKLEDKTKYVSYDNANYTIHSAWDDNQVLDIAGDSKENRANIQLYQFSNNNTVQQFNVVKVGDSYCLKNIYANKWLDIHLPYEDWANVQLWESNSSLEEKWTFEDAGNGYVFVRSNTGYYLDVQGDVARNNQNIQIFHFVGNNSQKWKFKKVVTEPDKKDKGDDKSDSKVVVSKPTINSIKAGKKSFTIKWKKKSVSGYQIQYSTSSNFKEGKNTKIISISSHKTTGKKISKLKSKKKYYVRIRGYKVINENTYCSKWSSKKSVKTK